MLTYLPHFQKYTRKCQGAKITAGGPLPTSGKPKRGGRVEWQKIVSESELSTEGGEVCGQVKKRREEEAK